MTVPVDPREGHRFCLYDKIRLADPFADYHYFRQHRPVFFHPGIGAWFVFRHDDVDRLFHDRRLSNARIGAYVDSVPETLRADVRPLMTDCFSRWVLSLDGDEHVRVRHRLQPAFAEPQVQAMTPMIEQIVREQLDAVSDRAAWDVAVDLAYPLPVFVISSLLGIEADARAHVIGWSDDLATFFNAPPPTIETTQRMAASARTMMAAVRVALEARRDAPTGDVLSGWLRPPLGTEPLGDAELIANAIVLLVAGHETTRNLIGNAVHLLLTHPDQLALLRADSALLHPAIEETLRFEPSNPLMGRVATEDIDIAGEVIHAGQFVYLCIGSANRDPAHFADADRFDITRVHGRHFAFGSGAHYCMGAILAKQEATIALREMLARFPTLRLDEARAPRWIHQAGLRGPASLPVRS